MNTKEKLLNILLREKELPAKMKTKIDERVETFWEGITNDAGLFLHENLDDNKHTQEEIKTLVQCVPGSLSCICVRHFKGVDDDDDYEHQELVLPIQSTVCDYADEKSAKAVSFIPLLAEEGSKLNVGGDGMRGGLLFVTDYTDNLLRLLVQAGGDGHDFDSVCLDVMKRLRKMDLLKKEDIKEYGLLECAMYSWAEQRFEYIVDWDPKTFKEICIDWDPKAFKECCISQLPWCFQFGEHFKVAFNAGIKYFPQHMGNLALRYVSGHQGKEGKDEAWEMIQDCLDEADPNKIESRNQLISFHDCC